MIRPHIYRVYLRLVLICWVMLGTIAGITQNSSLSQALQEADDIIETTPEQSIVICDSLLQIEGLSNMEKTHIYYTLNDAYYYLSDIKSSYKVAQKGLTIMPEGFPEEKKVLFLNAQGQNLDFLGKPDSAILIYKQGLVVAKVLDDSIEMSNLYYNIAVSFNNQLKFNQALTYFDSSYQIDYLTQDSFKLCYSLASIGQMQSAYFEHEQSIKKHQEALKYTTKEDPSQTCVIYTYIGSAFEKLNLPDSTKKYIQLASDCYDNVNNLATLHYLYLLKGRYYISIKDTLQAISVLDTAIHLAQKTGDKAEELKATFSKLLVSKEVSDDLNFPILLAQAEEYGLYLTLVTGYNIYAKKLMESGQYKEALQTKIKADTYQEDYNSQSTQRLIQTQIAKFDLLKKETEIKIAHEKLKTQRALWVNYSLIGLGLLLGITAWLLYKNKRDKLLLTQQKLEKEKKLLTEIADVESQAFRAQMNPHFIFNALNSIKGLIVNKEDKKAAIYISKFSKLVRMVLDNSRKKSISLDKELEILELYLKLEQQRFRDGYDYEITMDESLESDNIMIPPAITQPFVENSIWHGFKNNPRKNQLIIEFQKEGDFLKILITDNGIGRVASKQQNSILNRKSHGINITSQRLNNFSESKISTPILYKDQFDQQGQIIGTKVILLLPIKYQ